MPTMAPVPTMAPTRSKSGPDELPQIRRPEASHGVPSNLITDVSDTPKKDIHSQG